MSTESPSFDDLDPVEVENDTGGSWIDLEPGDDVAGTITGFNPLAGHNGVVEIDGRPMYCTAEIRRQIIAAFVEGGQIAVRCAEDEETFKNDDGEEVSFYPKDARFGPPGGED